MKTGVREQKIISLLESRGEMSVGDLSEMLGVSVSTLRKQLAEMQEKKLVIRTYGGVMSINPFPDETFDSKLHKSVAEKRRIAARARMLLKDGCSISLGSGTTVYGLGSLLDDLRRCVVYTDSIQTAEYLARCAALGVHVCGGILRSSTGTIIGSEACDFFKGIHGSPAAALGPATYPPKKAERSEKRSAFYIRFRPRRTSPVRGPRVR